MGNVGINNDVTVGGSKFHVQTSYSEPQFCVFSHVYHDGQVIDSRRVVLGHGVSSADIERRTHEVHQEMITEMEILYYMVEKVKTVRHAASANKLGQLFLKKNLVDDAIEHFRLALEIDPGYAEVYAYLGRALLMSGNVDRAIEVLGEGVEKAPDFADTHNYLGLAYLKAGQHAQAVEHLEQALALNDNYADAHFNLGLALLAEDLQDPADIEEGEAAGKRQKALEHLSRIVEGEAAYDPSVKEALEVITENATRETVDELIEKKVKSTADQLFNFENEFYLKFMYGGKGKDDSFIADYVARLKDILEEHPHYADVHNNLGIAYLIQCRNLFLKSLEAFRTALRINPEFARAEKNLKLAENDGKGFLILLRAVLK